jgi:hypothetical protein
VNRGNPATRKITEQFSSYRANTLVVVRFSSTYQFSLGDGEARGLPREDLGSTSLRFSFDVRHGQTLLK